MKLIHVAGLLSVALVACASAQKTEPTTSSSAALTSADGAAETGADSSGSGKGNGSTKTAAEDWAEQKIRAESETSKKEAQGPRESFDPLAMGSELEESSIPKVDVTPANQIRAKSAAELNAALGVVKSESSVEGAAQKLTQRLGKPTWTESPKGAEGTKKRVWTANAGATCQRLVLEADGSVELETASRNEWRMLAASARQNPCTGEIKRGMTEK